MTVYRYVLLVALGLTSAASVLAQDVTRMDPALARYLRSPEGAGKASADTPLDLVVHTRDVDALRHAGFDVNAVFDGFATVRVPVARVAELQLTRGVDRLEMGIDAVIDNDEAGAFVGARLLHDGLLGNQAYRGAGAIVCVIDSGIDWKHLDFRSTTDTTQSRILRLYDMTLSAQAGESLPQGLPTTYTKGVEYTRAQINNEIDGSPAGFVRSQDINGHGTHVTGTAAGNGGSMTPRQFVGMAPDADIVFVKSGDGSHSLANMTNGIKYCGEVAAAEGKPVAVNMSLGSDAGPHDGTDAKNLAVNQFLATPGRVLVQSAGNSGGSLIHRMEVMDTGASVAWTLQVPTYTAVAQANNFGVDTWFSESGPVGVTVTAPDGTTRVTSTVQGETVTVTTQGTVTIYNGISSNSDREIYVNIDDSGIGGVVPAAGSWTISFTNNAGTVNTAHSWLFDSSIGDKTAVLVGADAHYTVSNASAMGIAAGAYVHRNAWGAQSGNYGYPVNRQDLRASFSSQGPSRDERVMPHISAPGQAMLSARSSSASFAASSITPDGKHVQNQGTSMAAPVVTGSAALLLAARPTLTAAQVRALLQDNAIVDGPVSEAGAVPNNEFGAGKLNVYQAMARLVNPASTSAMQIVQYDAPATATLGVTLTVDNTLLLAFSSASGGVLRGTLFHPSVAVPSGGYDVRVFQNNASAVGAQVGTTVNFPMAAIHPYSWNYIGLDAAGVTATAGGEYFLAITPRGSNGAFRHDGATTVNRTFVTAAADLSGLSVRADDALIRPILTSDATAIPVETAAVAQGELILAAAGPNPAASHTAFVLAVPTSGTVRLEVYDMLGRRVRTLLDETLAAQTLRRVDVDASALAPGMYLVRAQQGGQSVTQRLVVTR